MVEQSIEHEWVQINRSDAVSLATEASSQDQLDFCAEEATSDRERKEDPSHRDSTASSDEDDRNEDLQLALAMSLKRCQEHETAPGADSEGKVCWTGKVLPNSLFSAHWHAFVSLDEIKEAFTLDPWGDRVFLPSECDGDCIHRSVILEQNVDPLHGTTYYIRTSLLRAPTECGFWTECWRLRDSWGRLVGPILQIK